MNLKVHDFGFFNVQGHKQSIKELVPKSIIFGNKAKHSKKDKNESSREFQKRLRKKKRRKKWGKGRSKRGRGPQEDTENFFGGGELVENSIPRNNGRLLRKNRNLYYYMRPTGRHGSFNSALLQRPASTAYRLIFPFSTSGYLTDDYNRLYQQQSEITHRVSFAEVVYVLSHLKSSPYFPKNRYSLVGPIILILLLSFVLVASLALLEATKTRYERYVLYAVLPILMFLYLILLIVGLCYLVPKAKKDYLERREEELQSILEDFNHDGGFLKKGLYWTTGIYGAWVEVILNSEPIPEPISAHFGAGGHQDVHIQPNYGVYGEQGGGVLRGETGARFVTGFDGGGQTASHSPHFVTSHEHGRAKKVFGGQGAQQPGDMRDLSGGRNYAHYHYQTQDIASLPSSARPLYPGYGEVVQPAAATTAPAVLTRNMTAGIEGHHVLAPAQTRFGQRERQLGKVSVNIVRR